MGKGLKTHFFIPTKPTKSGFHGYGWVWIWSLPNLSFGDGLCVCVWDPYLIPDSVFFRCDCMNRPEESLSCKGVYWSYNMDLINQLKILLYFWFLEWCVKSSFQKKFIFNFFGVVVVFFWHEKAFLGVVVLEISKKKVNPPSICNFFKC